MRDEIYRKSKGLVQTAADVLQHSFIEGLGSYYPDINIINLPFVSSYPLRYRDMRIKSGFFTYRTAEGAELRGKDVGFNNLTGWKQFSRRHNAERVLGMWCEEYSREDKCVVIYASLLPFVEAAANVKKKYPELKIVLIVPDLPEFMHEAERGIKGLVRKYWNHRILSHYSEIDGFVLLTEHMAERLPIGGKPTTVVEGIYNPSDPAVKTLKKYYAPDQEYGRFILYTGTLEHRHGIMGLVDAFSLTENPDWKLLICGAGNAEDDIRECAKKDSRIKFMGQLPREDILKLQRRATLLVNPRTPEGEFTKYSFPSKTLEYMGSGTPVLLYPLPGIGKEYLDRCFVIGEPGTEAFSRKISEAMSLPDEELKRIGTEAKKFVETQKNPLMQACKVAALIAKL